jgi:pSer/pThr/pTyr-binding forkhead associated (FHA) protein
MLLDPAPRDRCNGYVTEIRISRSRRVGRHDLGEGTVTIGRSSANDIVLSSRSVSRTHCAIETAEDVSRIRDLDSHHGTFVNGERIEGERVLVEGDSVGVGGFILAFGAASTDGPSDDPAPAADEDHPAHDTIDEREHELDEREQHLREREQALEQSTEALEARARALEDERNEALDAERAAHAETTAERDELRAHLDESEGRIASLEERDSVSRETLDAETQRTHDAHERIETLSRDLAEHLARHEETARRLAGGDQKLDELRATVRHLYTAARGAADAWRVLPSIEQQWFDADQDVEESAGAGEDVRALAEAERESAARELELAHAALDDALAKLDAEIARRRGDPEVDPGPSTPAEPPPRRRWWRAQSAGG